MHFFWFVDGAVHLRLELAATEHVGELVRMFVNEVDEHLGVFSSNFIVEAEIAQIDEVHVFRILDVFQA